ncbi:hypothetical protein FOA43_004465 [Brettanomyces nanus]|uniref:Dol-P-Glc:Glc(2)Man(9)GlcNAc(2)-PP-Dol alpha-1,2-glucosyltransferase n=1 Tax=Eeniella nana TaxID=13502 RepID=A0A875RXV9_EENNA|nr:uncharacterized protein FOA43_004465 [Brettanomyces nanus]QPG77067.1 hypothetical protein FOA43_004465 [Brettanomyces nanus]
MSRLEGLLDLVSTTLGVIPLRIFNQDTSQVVNYPFIDEIFHVRQAQAFCEGDWSYWDPKITTPPGLYFLAALYSRIGGVDCDLINLRTLNFIGGLTIAIITFYLRTKVKNPGFLTLSIFMCPLLAIYYALFYTDVWSTCLVLLSYTLAVTRPFSSDFLNASISALFGLFSVFLRQTNIVWTAFAMIALMESRDIASTHPDTRTIHRLKSFLSTTSRNWYLLVPYVIVALLFAYFVVINGGITLGDKQNHQMSLHLMQMFYWVFFTALFTAPLWFSIGIMTDYIKHNFLTVKGLFFNSIWIPFIGLIVHNYTIIHPFLLADNRHYTFYLVRRLIARDQISRYQLIPVYHFTCYVLYQLMKQCTTRLSPSNSSVVMFIALLCSTALTIVPSPLIEPRYYIVPFVFFRLLINPSIQPIVPIFWFKRYNRTIRLILELTSFTSFTTPPLTLRSLRSSISKVSRGSIPALFLNSDLDAESWLNHIKQEMDDFKDVGGFSLLYGQLRHSDHGIMPLYIFSNRYKETVSVFNHSDQSKLDSSFHQIQFYKTLGLSNSPFLQPWPKVTHGKNLLDRAVQQAIQNNWSQQQLVSKLLDILSTANPPDPETWLKYRFEDGFNQMVKSIFIPPIQKPAQANLTLARITSNPSLTGKYYGTRTQTVILVDKNGNVTYIEKNLHTGECLYEVPTITKFQFHIQALNIVFVQTMSKLSQADFQLNVVNRYTDVIGAKLGGKVLATSNEWFAVAENLIKSSSPIRDATKFTYAGAWYDGWETRRHNPEEADWVVFKMGVASATLVGCEVDTAFFNGNQAPFISVEATTLDDDSNYGDSTVCWDSVIPKMACGPSQKQFFARPDPTDKAYTHVRLRMYPDGGIARFRLYGKVYPIIPLDVSTIVDTASCLQGGVCVRTSDEHFGSASNLLLPGRGHDMSDGWETTRSRSYGHRDWAIIKLGFRTQVEKIVVDTAYYRGNYPEYIYVEGIDSDKEVVGADDSSWEQIVDKSKTEADKEHGYEILSSNSYTHVKLIMIPDGGIKRLRVFGKIYTI